MNKFLLLVAAIFLTGYLYSSLYKFPGFYDPILDQIHCTNMKSCLHEIGHKADRHSGWISYSSGYRHCVDVYRAMLYAYPEKRDKNTFDIYQYPGLNSLLWQNNNPATISFWTGGWGGYFEFYADFLMWYDGDYDKMPAGLRDFYDWDLIKLEMKKLGL